LDHGKNKGFKENIYICFTDHAKAFNYNDWARTLKEFLGKGADAMIALEEKEGKYNLNLHEKRLEVIIEKWDEIISAINEEIPTLTTLTKLYDKVGLPRSMDEIGIDKSILKMTFMAAKDIRDKYVLPRLCFDLGIIEELNFN
jgi:glycerol-1-phosphate dehydrogenase [NAD(P)+]